MKKILITGYDGFIGSSLISVMKSKNYQITGLSRTTKKNIKIQKIKKDIVKATSVDIGKNSCIIHLAAITDVAFCQEHPVECFKTNVFGTQNLLELARKKDCDFIYVSTSHVYGTPQKLPIDENHPRNATTIYSASKIGGEICCESYARSYGMDISILRLFSTYGPGSATHLVISKIISQLSSKSIKLGNLYPKRDFIYITDAVKAIEIALKKLKRLNVYNVGTGKSYSILEICNMLKKLSGRDVPIISSRSRGTDIDEVVSNPSKIKKLGWKPTVPILKGLRMTLDGYKNNHSIF